MARTPKVPANKELLTWAREIAGYDLDDAARRLQVKTDRLQAWEQGEDQPTVVQLRKLSALYRRTPAFFFLPEPPEPDLPRPPDFRSRAVEGALSPALRREMRRAVDRRAAYLDLQGPPHRTLEVFSDVNLSDLEAAAEQVRTLLDFPVSEQQGISDLNLVLRRWVGAVEDVGVLVFQMSRIRHAEARGFSIYERVAPVIVLNGADPPPARAFTLLHELCHLLNKSGGLCTLWVDRNVEHQCNAFASEVLMPAAAVVASLTAREPLEAVAEVATAFRVSRDAAAVRLRVLGRITQTDVDAVLNETEERLKAQRQADKEREGGPMHHVTHLRNLGPRYVAAILDAVDSQQISLTDAAHYLESKVATIDRMGAELERRGIR